MTTTSVFSQASDGYLTSENGTYATARAGTGTLSVGGLSDTLSVGQSFPASVYTLNESFLSFDTSSIPDIDTVTAVSLDLMLSFDGSTTNFVVGAYTYDFGASVTTADWVPGASLAGMTLLANLFTSGIGATEAYKSFSSAGAVFNSAINLTGSTSMVLASDRLQSNTAPTGSEYVQFYAEGAAGTTKDPMLVITHNGPITDAQVI